MRRRWFSKRAILLHLVILIWFPGCLVAGWWQVTVALSGDNLAYLYSVEWPVFAIFGAVVWWNFIHDDPATTGQRGLRRASRPEPDATTPAAAIEPAVVRRVEEEDEDLKAYNDYLEQLATRSKPKTWRSG